MDIPLRSTSHNESRESLGRMMPNSTASSKTSSIRSRFLLPSDRLKVAMTSVRVMISGESLGSAVAVA